MLIESHRHTRDDLALWRELEAADITHYRVGRVAEKAEQAKQVIREFAAAGPCYCSVSWGKDSVVLAHLVRSVAPEVVLVHLRGVPTSNPDCPRVRDAFLAAFPGPYREVEVRYSSVDLTGREEAQAAGDKLWLATMREQGDRYLCGIRADESAGRRIRFRKWGLTGPSSCGPLGWMTGDDVFAHLAHHGLPVHPAYAMLGGGRWPRKSLRTDELLGARGNQFGRAEWEAEYYSDVIRRLTSA